MSQPDTDETTKRNLRWLASGAFLLVFLVIAGAVLYRLLFSAAPAPLPVPEVSSNMKTEMPGPTAGAIGAITAMPPASSIVGETATTVANITATNGPLRILSLNVVPTLPGLAIQSGNGYCAGDTVIQKGASCTLVISWTPVRSGKSAAVVNVTTDGTPPLLSTAISVEGVAQPETAPAPTTSTAPSATTAPARPIVVLQTAPQSTQATISPVSADFSTASLPNDWSKFGIERVTGSYPVDMTNVITSDRKLAVKLAIPVDTRHCTQVNAFLIHPAFGSTGNRLLLPARSSFTGHCSGGTKNGNDLVDIAWDLITTPDGTRYSLNSSSADQMGRGGLPTVPSVNNNAKYAITLARSVLSAASIVALGGQTSAFGTDAGARASGQVTQDLTQLSQMIINDNFDLKQYGILPKDTIIDVELDKDLWLYDPAIDDNGSSTIEPARSLPQSAPASRQTPGNDQKGTGALAITPQAATDPAPTAPASAPSAAAARPVAAVSAEGGNETYRFMVEQGLLNDSLLPKGDAK